MKSPSNEMEEAIAEWLRSHEAHKRISPRRAVFAQSWCGPRHHVAEAFTDFGKALLKEHRVRQLEDVAASPEQGINRQ
jgi:hypothetical protein